MKGDIEAFFFDWYDGRYDIRLCRRGNSHVILKDAILKGDYDAAADTVSGTVEFEGEEPSGVIFSHDEKGNAVWTVNGESTVME